MIVNNTGWSSVKLFLESKNATVHIGNSRKIWSLNSPIMGSNSNKLLCSVESVSIPLSYYTLNKTNNRFSFNGISGEIPFGNYNAYEMAKELTDLAPFTVTFNPLKSKFILTGTINISYSIDAIENHIYNILGLEFNTTFVSKLTAPSVCNLIYTSGIYISLNNIENNNIDTASSNQSSTVLLRIPINQPTNTYLQYFNNIGFKNLLSTEVISQIDISILDDNRHHLELSDNVNWSIVLRVDYERVIVENTETSKINKMKYGMN